MIEIDVTNAQEHAQWLNLWERPSGVAQAGVQGRLSNNVKFYRAWASVMLGDEEKRLESPEYEACDAADVDESRLAHGLIIPEIRQREEMAREEAANARALMTSAQRSPKDMQAIAYALAAQLTQESYAYDEVMLQAARQRTYDEQCLAVAKPWLRGMQLLLEQGTDEEQKLVRYIFGRK